MNKLKQLPLSKHFGIYLGFLAFGVLLAILSTVTNLHWCFAVISVILGFVWHFIFIKCPHCGKKGFCEKKK